MTVESDAEALQRAIDEGLTLVDVFRLLTEPPPDIRSTDPAERAQAVYSLTGSVERADAVYRGEPDPLTDNN